MFFEESQELHDEWGSRPIFAACRELEIRPPSSSVAQRGTDREGLGASGSLDASEK
jgi:hypothetical protein